MKTPLTNQKQSATLKIDGVVKEISFQEERLLEFKSIRHSFTDYISKAFVASHPNTDHMVYGSVGERRHLIYGQAFEYTQSFLHKKSGYFDNFLQVLYLDAGYEERAKDQIAGFEEFLKRRLEGAFHGIAEKEMRLIRKVQLAIAACKGYTCVSLYNKFKWALAEYFLWLERKINKSIFYIKYLSRFLANSGIIVDFRQLLRAIMRFLCRRLDNEHSVNQEISNNFKNYFFGLTTVNYEYPLYKRNN